MASSNQITNIRKIEPLHGTKNLVTWEEDFKRLAQLEDVWIHFQPDQVKALKSPPNPQDNQWYFIKNPIGYRRRAPANQKPPKFNRSVYKDAYKRYRSFQNTKDKTIGLLTLYMDKTIQIHSRTYTRAIDFYN